MEIKAKTIDAKGIKYSLVEGDKPNGMASQREIARAYLYIMHNALHQEPFGLLEDVYVTENKRGKGLGTQLVQQVIQAAKEQGCYKLIATSRKSRSQVHQMYNKLGFQERGLEFRLDF